MKKALFIGNYPNKIEPYLRSFFQVLIHQMADLGIECTVIAPVSITHYRGKINQIKKKTKDVTTKGNTVRVYHPRFVSFSSKKIGRINTGYYSEKAFQVAAVKCAKGIKEKFDFVYGHFFLTGGLAAVRIGNELSIPSFIAYGECDFKSQILDDYGTILERDVSGLTGIISVSSKNTNELKQFHIFNNIPIITAPNATDLSLFHKKDKIECRNRLGIPLEKFIVGFVGGFIERKGDKRLLEAVKGLKGVYVAFAGKGNDPPSGEKVLFCAPLKHEEICTFLNAIDVFCLPTLSEGSCNAIVEAMACGLPIISSDLSFNDDALNESNSIRVNPKSVREIQEAILRLYKDSEERQRLCKSSEETSQNFSIEKRTINILSFIEACSKRRK